ncbi:hypothetical protein ONZ43_g2894 [Nemania bipapillata]|uniref:Uncharacterized protein n=1 Tax=Nemania bipapillata TaxID=110536 RepID=A0ACC2IYV1_9PEZI|nr:hypothetical protein ONZ43_g2894 [Nemania bipapillata]
MKIAQPLFLFLGLTAFEAAASPRYQHAPPTTASQPSKRMIPHTHIQHEKRTAVQGGAWAKVERAKREAFLPMRIGLKQPNLEDGHNLLMEISNPESENYGKHLSAEEVVDFFAPLESSVETVKNWLMEAGIASHTISQSANKQLIVREKEDGGMNT